MGGGSSALAPTPDTFPSNYDMMELLGKGSFGRVYKAVSANTKETVVVKIQKADFNFYKEFYHLASFKEKNLDKCNIVRLIDSFILSHGTACLTFEVLDVTLFDFLDQRNFSPLRLCDIRSVVQQMATALGALRALKVIHADIKLDNIMLVDQKVKPLRVKLIDFGEALATCEAEPGTNHQNINFRAPEIFLGLPFSEAIDMWSLGVVMGVMMFGFNFLADTNIEQDVVEWIVQLLGVPPDYLLNAGLCSQVFFMKQRTGFWMLRTQNTLRSQEMIPLSELFMQVTGEKKQCIHLLMEMLKMDAGRRTKPSGVLSHPFITNGTFHTSDTPTSVSPPVRSQRLVDKGEQKYKTYSCSSSSLSYPGGFSLMQSTLPEQCLGSNKDSNEQQNKASISSSTSTSSVESSSTLKSSSTVTSSSSVTSFSSVKSYSIFESSIPRPPALEDAGGDQGQPGPPAVITGVIEHSKKRRQQEKNTYWQYVCIWMKKRFSRRVGVFYP